MRATERTEHRLQQQSWSRGREVQVLVPRPCPDRREPQLTDRLALASDLRGRARLGAVQQTLLSRRWPTFVGW